MSEVLSNPPFPSYKGQEPYIFASYSHSDGEEVFTDIECLDRLGYRIWYDEGIDPGNEWPEEIAQALLGASCFVVFISPRSVASKNVRNEVNFALAQEKPFLAIHIEATDLSSGLGLQIGSIQAVMKYRMQAESYFEKLCGILPESLRSVEPRGSKPRLLPPKTKLARRPKQGKTKTRSSSRGLILGLSAMLVFVLAAVGIIYHLSRDAETDKSGGDSTTETKGADTKPRSEKPADMPADSDSEKLTSVRIGPVQLEVNSFELVDSFDAGETKLDVDGSGKIAVIGLTLTQLRDYTVAELDQIGQTEFGKEALKARELLDLKLIHAPGQFLLGNLQQGEGDPSLPISECQAIRVDEGAVIPQVHEPGDSEQATIHYVGSHSDTTRISVAFLVDRPIPPALLFFSPAMDFGEVNAAAIYYSSQKKLSSVDYAPENLLGKIKDGDLVAVKDPPLRGNSAFRFPAVPASYSYWIELDVADYLTDPDRLSPELDKEFEGKAVRLISDASRFDLNRQDHQNAYAFHAAKVLELPPETKATIRFSGVQKAILTIEFGNEGVFDISWQIDPPYIRATWKRPPVPTPFREWKLKEGDPIVARLRFVEGDFFLLEEADETSHLFKLADFTPEDSKFVAWLSDERAELEMELTELMNLVKERPETRTPQFDSDLVDVTSKLGAYPPPHGVFRGNSKP